MEMSHEKTSVPFVPANVDRRNYFAETAIAQLLANESRVLLWAKERSNYITKNKRVVLRIRDASNFGFKTRFATQIRGELFLIDWRTAAAKFQPNVLEIYGLGNPLPYLLYSLDAAPTVDSDDALADTFKHVDEVSLFKTDVLFEDVGELLGRLTVLAAFALNQVCFVDADLQKLVQHLERLNLRAISLSGGLPDTFLENVFATLPLEVVSFCSESGMRIKQLADCSAISPTTRLLYLQEVSFDQNSQTIKEGPVDLLNVVPRLFPRLQTLIWDWTIVEPFDAQSELVVAALIKLYQELKLKVLAIPMYVPYKEVLEDVQRIGAILDEHHVPYQNRRFCSAGVSQTNFTLLCLGEDSDDAADGALMSRVRAAFIQHKRTRLDDLCSLLYITTGEERYRPIDESSTLSLDFGGFDAASVREKCLA